MAKISKGEGSKAHAKALSLNAVLRLREDPKVLTAVSHPTATFRAVWPKAVQLCHSREGPEHRPALGWRERFAWPFDALGALTCCSSPENTMSSPSNLFRISSTSNASLSLYKVRRSRVSLYLQLEGCIAGLWAPKVSVDSELQYYCSRQALKPLCQTARF